MSAWSGTIVFEVSSADPDSATPVWVDLSVYARPLWDDVELSLGRQNDLDGTEPSQLTLTLNNRDGRFTYGNTASPYFSWWGPGRKCRLRESVGGVDRTLFVGYLQTPTETLVTTDIDQRVQISAMDRLARLNGVEPFPSTLGAYILGTAPTVGTMVGYWPLSGDSRTFSSVPATATALTPRRGPIITQGTVAGPPGDDESYVSLDSTGDTAPSRSMFSATFTGGTVNSGDAIAVVGWVRMSADTTTQAWSCNDQAVGEVNLSISPTQITGRGKSAATGDAIYAGGLGTLVWQLVTVRFSLPSGVVTLWIGRNIVATATAVGPISPVFFNTMNVAASSTGVFMSLAHLQVYVGGESTVFNYAAHRAQLDLGLKGLQRQTTGDRIRSVLQFAGVPAAEYASTVDLGTSVMQRARLSGKTPHDALRDAERTEQGLLYVDSGVITFKDRRTLYNI